MAASQSDPDEVTDTVDTEVDADADAVTAVVPQPKATSRPAAPSEEKAPAAPKGIVVTPLMLGLAAAVVLLAVTATAFGFLWRGAVADRNSAQATIAAAAQAEDRAARAKDIAMKYAIGAATVDYQNLAPWRAALVANTTPELAHTLSTASTDLEQLYTPLQWQSTATPRGAIVVSDRDDIIVVNLFVNVITKQTQNPQGVPTIASYAVTIDTKQNWVISDVSSVEGAKPAK